MSDYHALAQRVSAGISGVRGCLLLSRDGMVLGADPEGADETSLKTAWLRFAALGEADRSYVEFPDQLWAFVRRGGYAAFVVADAGVRPGLLIDLLDQLLLAGEAERVHDREAFRLPEAPVAPSGKPRTSLHKAERPMLPPEPMPVASREVRLIDHGTVSDPAPREEPNEPPQGADADAGDAPPAERASDEEATEVDRILLAKEFAGLLQVPTDDDEATR